MNTPRRIGQLYKKLISSDLEKFPKKRKPINAPEGKGVYIIYNKNDEVVHVGCTPRAKGGIRQRLENHLHGQSSFVEQYKNLDGHGKRLRNGYSFRCKVVRNPEDLKYLEALAIGKLCPKHIGKG